MNDPSFTQNMSDSITQQAGVPLQEQIDQRYLDSLVGENRKYRTPDQLAKAYLNADTMIETLKQEKKDIEAQNQVLQGVVEKLKPSYETETLETPVPNNTNNPSVDQEDIERRVRDTVREERMLEIAQETQNKSIQALESAYGTTEAGFEAINKILAKNPSLRVAVDNLARTDTEGFVRFLKAYDDGVTEPPRSATPGLSNKPSANAIRATDSGLTAVEAREIRKKDPHRYYYDNDFRAQLEQAVAKAHEKGEDFWG